MSYLKRRCFRSSLPSSDSPTRFLPSCRGFKHTLYEVAMNQIPKFCFPAFDRSVNRRLKFDHFGQRFVETPVLRLPLKTFPAA